MKYTDATEMQEDDLYNDPLGDDDSIDLDDDDSIDLDDDDYTDNEDV